MNATTTWTARRADLTRRAVAAAVAAARTHGLDVQDPVVLNDLFSVTVHLRPAPVVARVPTWITRLRTPTEELLDREISVAAFLSGQGAPVVAPSAELPPGPHISQGLAMSFWTYLEPAPDRTPTAADCSAMLGDLHPVLRAYPGDLPPLVPSVVDLPRWLNLLDAGTGPLSPADIDRIHAAADRLTPYLETLDADAQPLHGDAHPGNLIATGDGLMWIDLEEVCRGPVEWDLATIGDRRAVLAHHRPDPDRLALCGLLRELQVVLCLTAVRDVFGDLNGWDEAIRATLRTLIAAG